MDYSEICESDRRRAKARNDARQKIQDAMAEYGGLFPCDPPREPICYNSYDKLSRQQIDQGVLALVLYLNMSGGSYDEMDLYKLVRIYLRYKPARLEMNKIVKKYPLDYSPPKDEEGDDEEWL